MIIVDGITYNIPVKSLKRKAAFLDNYAERTQDGVLHRDLIGVYYNYELTFGRSSNNPSDYAALWLKFTEPVTFHTVQVPDDNGYTSFSAYFAEVGDELISDTTNHARNFWRNLTVNFIAKSPARTP